MCTSHASIHIHEARGGGASSSGRVGEREESGDGEGGEISLKVYISVS